MSYHSDRSLVDAATQQVHLEKLLAQVLDIVRQSGASAGEASLITSHGFSVSVRRGELETIEYDRNKNLSVAVYFGPRTGSASTSDFSAEGLSSTVQAACDIARFTSEDNCSGLADAALMAQTIPDLDLYHPWSISIEQATDLAKQCESSAFAVDPRIHNSKGATTASYSGTSIYGNSHGFIGGWSATHHTLSCLMIAREEGSMQQDHWYSIARNAIDLEAAETVGQRAAERTVQRLNARSLSTRAAPVLFSAEAATGLLSCFIAAINGSNLYRKASFLCDSLGKPVFPDRVHIHEQPHLLQAMGSAPFDSEGVKTQARDIVCNGVLQSYILDSYTARKLGMKTTANAGGVHNLILDSSGSYDLDALLKQMNTGLLVTKTMGGINILTGDYSRGASGFWVEGGEICYPVQEITIAGRLQDMFKGIQAIGSDVEKRGNIRTGSILIDNMTIAG